MHTSQPLLLIILDGWGYEAAAENNAITQAKTPVWDELWATCPHTLISASGLDVGLPTGQMGNSEVGHMTLGAGRVIYQDLTLINKAIQDGSFNHNPEFLKAIATAKQNQSALHIMGLLSPGGVHSHEDQIFALIKLAAQQQVRQVYVHAFLDGRDTPPQSAKQSLQRLADICAQYDNTGIASIMGRFYAMDRDKRLERTQAAVDLLVHNKAPYTAPNALAALDLAYARGETDEFVQPTQILSAPIRNDDVVVFMNFRADRARQLSYALISDPKLMPSYFVSLTEYDPQLAAHVAFPKPNITNTLGEILAQNNLSQLRIAETEKYAHVTFFFNAGRELVYNNEERILIPSPKVNTYDQAPAMAAIEITAQLENFIQNKKFAVIICNFANADMLGHTGQMPAAIQAIEILDQCLGKIVKAIRTYGGQALITADHGNAEIMWDEKNQQPHTAHTTNLVPVLYVGNSHVNLVTGSKLYGLKDIAPTILDLLSITKPAEMEGESLIEK